MTRITGGGFTFEVGEERAFNVLEEMHDAGYAWRTACRTALTKVSAPSPEFVTLLSQGALALVDGTIVDTIVRFAR